MSNTRCYNCGNEDANAELIDGFMFYACNDCSASENRAKVPDFSKQIQALNDRLENLKHHTEAKDA